MVLKTLFADSGYEVHDWPAKDRFIPSVRVVKNGIDKVLDIDLEVFANDQFWETNYDKLKPLFVNGIVFPTGKTLTKVDVEEFIELSYPFLTPSEKAIKLLEFINSKTKFDGDAIGISFRTVSLDQWWRYCYLKNDDEFFFYLETLKQLGHIDWQVQHSDGYSNVSLTLSGLEQVIKSQETKTSKYCFVAMSFDDKLVSVYENGILPALQQTGFSPLILSREHIESDVTINDAILASIKKSRFTIADFTQHKHGVYFEAGYALGRGQKVIYTCNQEDIVKAHFDTRNYQHIVWKDHHDLRSQLINKIEVFILD